MLTDDSICLEKKGGRGVGGSVLLSLRRERRRGRVHSEDPYFSIARNAAGSTSGMLISSLFSASSP